MTLVGTIDAGTSSVRFIVFDTHGSIVASHQERLALITPRPGWVEQDPIEMIESIKKCIVRVMACPEMRGKAGRVKCVGIANQRETTILWDGRTGKPFHNAIVWQDNRTKSICDAMSQEGGKDRFRGITGLPISTYFSGFKIKWLMNHVPGIREKTVHFGTVDTWIMFNLIRDKPFLTDVSNASRTFLFDLKSSDWSPRMVREFGFDREKLKLARIVSNSERYGLIHGTDTPLDGKVAISGCLGDQQSAMVGQLCFQRNHSKVTLGTGAFILTNTGRRPVQSTDGHGCLTTVLFKMGPDEPTHYALEGAIGVAGQVVDWIGPSNLGIVPKRDEMNRLARAKMESNSLNEESPYFVSAFNGLYSPHWDPSATGILIGLTQKTDTGDVCLAALEGVAHRVNEVVAGMAQDIGQSISILKVDGGLCQSDPLCQMQANLVGCRVARPAMVETTALGAAIAAGMACNVWTDLDHVKRAMAKESTMMVFEPEREGAEMIEKRKRGWKRAIKRAKGWNGTETEKEKDESNPNSNGSLFIGMGCLAIALAILFTRKQS